MSKTTFEIDFIVSHGWEYQYQKGARLNPEDPWVSVQEALEEVLLDPLIEKEYKVFCAMDAKSAALYEEYLEGE
jgi:hypothetical protein